MNHYNILNNLNTYNFIFTLNICIDIDEEYQKHLNANIYFQMYGTNVFDIITEVKFEDPRFDENEAYFNRKLESLVFLRNLSVLKSYKCDDNYDDIDPIVEAEINPAEFEEFKTILSQIYHNKYIEKHPAKSKFGCFIDNYTDAPKPLAIPINTETLEESIKKPQNEIIYKIKYTAAREILLNNFLLSKINFNSENDNVFGYIYRNPNKIINIKELEKSIGGTITKNLHKIIENLGFKREFKKAFFNISKNDIFFRNPLKQKELDDLGISRLKLHQ